MAVPAGFVSQSSVRPTTTVFELEALEGLPCGPRGGRLPRQALDVAVVSLEAKGPCNCILAGHSSGQVLRLGDPSEFDDNDDEFENSRRPADRSGQNRPGPGTVNALQPLLRQARVNPTHHQRPSGLAFASRIQAPSPGRELRCGKRAAPWRRRPISPAHRVVAAAAGNFPEDLDCLRESRSRTIRGFGDERSSA